MAKKVFGYSTPYASCWSPSPGFQRNLRIRTFVDVFTDVSPLFVINNEISWYEGWMIHDITVPDVSPPRPDVRLVIDPGDSGRHAQFGKITEDDAEILKRMGTHHNVPGNTFTLDGKAPHFPSEPDQFPNIHTNVVPIHESMGAYNAMQQSDVHSYWEFSYTGTNWIHPLYALPFTGGLPDDFGKASDAFQDGEIGNQANARAPWPPLRVC